MVLTRRDELEGQASPYLLQCTSRQPIPGGGGDGWIWSHGVRVRRRVIGRLNHGNNFSPKTPQFARNPHAKQHFGGLTWIMGPTLAASRPWLCPLIGRRTVQVLPMVASLVTCNGHILNKESTCAINVLSRSSNLLGNQPTHLFAVKVTYSTSAAEV